MLRDRALKFNLKVAACMERLEYCGIYGKLQRMLHAFSGPWQEGIVDACKGKILHQRMNLLEVYTHVKDT